MITKSNRRRTDGGFSLAEAVTAMAVALITIGGLVSGFMQSSREAEYSSYSLAAQSQALRSLEQVRAAKWDPLGFPQVDQVWGSNFPMRVEILDVPMRGDNITYVTNFTTITVVSTDPPLKLIRVDSVWRFMERGMCTNTAATYRAPDQ
jgi:Tfp pilus assembly protein PilV